MVKVGQVYEFRAKNGEVHRHTIKRIAGTWAYTHSHTFGAEALLQLVDLGGGPVWDGKFVLVEDVRTGGEE